MKCARHFNHKGLPLWMKTSIVKRLTLVRCCYMNAQYQLISYSMCIYRSTSLYDIIMQYIQKVAIMGTPHI